jgi:hypothetical protein
MFLGYITGWTVRRTSFRLITSAITLDRMQAPPVRRRRSCQRTRLRFVFTKFDHLIRYPLHIYEFMFPMPQAGVPAGTNQERNPGACQGIP